MLPKPFQVAPTHLDMFDDSGLIQVRIAKPRSCP